MARREAAVADTVGDKLEVIAEGQGNVKAPLAALFSVRVLRAPEASETDIVSSFGDKMVPFLSDCVLRTEGYIVLYVVRSRRQARQRCHTKVTDIGTHASSCWAWTT